MLFFAPSAEDDGVDAAAVPHLPRALRRRLNYAHPDIRWNTHDKVRRKRPGRAFLEAGLVREYRTDRLLEVLADILSGEPSSAVQLAALQFGHDLFPGLNDTQRTMLRAIRFRLPTVGGTWADAPTLVFSASWGTPGARLFAQLLSGEDSTALAAASKRLIMSPADWPLSVRSQRQWREFLRTIGVQDGLPLERPALRPAQREGIDLRPSVVATEIGLEPALAGWWSRDVDEVWSQGSHLYTQYSLSSPLTCLPATNQIASHSSKAKSIFAQLIVVGLADWAPDVLSVTVNRPSRPFQHRDPHEWPTPALSFLRHERWLSLELSDDLSAQTSYVTPSEAWATFTGEMPPFAQRLTREIRRLLEDPTASPDHSRNGRTGGRDGSWLVRALSSQARDHRLRPAAPWKGPGPA
jgi:hypothetical protein